MFRRGVVLQRDDRAVVETGIGTRTLASLTSQNLCATPEHYVQDYIYLTDRGSLAAKTVDAVTMSGAQLTPDQAEHILSTHRAGKLSVVAQDEEDPNCTVALMYNAPAASLACPLIDCKVPYERIRPRGLAFPPEKDEIVITLSAAPNFRVVAGQRTADGRRVGDGLLYRSDAVLDPDAADMAALRAAAVTLVCDLRSDAERSDEPNTWWQGEEIEVLDIDLLAFLPSDESPWHQLAIDGSEAGARATMRNVYAAFPKAALSHLAALFRRLAHGDVPALIHCTAGKDRTGFVVAMLLAALGAARDDIERDYLSSRGRRTDRVANATRRMIQARTGKSLPAAALEALLDVETSYLRASFTVIEREYGGMRGYLAATGLSDDDVARLRDRLLV